MRIAVIAATLVASAAAQLKGATDGTTVAEDCSLRIIVARPQLDPQSGALGEGAEAKVCCPLGHDETSSECKVLYGDYADALEDTESAQNITMHHVRPLPDRGSAYVPVTAAGVPELSEGVRKAFGESEAVRPVMIKRHTDNRRRLQSANTGAIPITHWSRYHGKRKLLVVIIDTLVSASGERRSWPSSCTIANVNKLMWGLPTGVQFQVGASPWASSEVSSSCRTRDNVCYYNARDHMLTLSRGAVELDRARSVVLKLSQVTGYPDDFCNWVSAWSAIRRAVENDGTYDWKAYDHRAVFLPSHCAAGQGSLPGIYTLNNLCPGTGRGDAYPDTIVHELGHNVGMSHAKTPTSEYGDGSNVMGNPGYSRTATVNLAHRHMFSWLSELPFSVPALQLLPRESKRFDRQYEFADVLNVNKPAGSVWGVEVREGDRSYYLSYRSCAGYDYAAHDGWCGAVQISYRTMSYVNSMHVAVVQTRGQSKGFGTDNAATVTLLDDISRATRGTVSVRVSGKLRPWDEAEVERVDDGVLAY